MKNAADDINTFLKIYKKEMHFFSYYQYTYLIKKNRINIPTYAYNWKHILYS